MYINEVEEKVGLSKKSIRYYEENGLLNPNRNQSNGYRIYNEEDIIKLQKIKFFRELGVPISSLKLLNTNKLSLSECMEEQISKIDREVAKYQKAKNICLEVAKTSSTLNAIDIESLSKEMNILNKEGFTLRDISTSHHKKIMGAILSSIIFCLFFFFLIGIITYFQITEVEKMPWILYAFFMFIMALPPFCIISNLIIRINEIKKGEEDEASKY